MYRKKSVVLFTKLVVISWEDKLYLIIKITKEGEAFGEGNVTFTCYSIQF